MLHDFRLPLWTELDVYINVDGSGWIWAELGSCIDVDGSSCMWTELEICVDVDGSGWISEEKNPNYYIALYFGNDILNNNERFYGQIYNSY